MASCKEDDMKQKHLAIITIILFVTTLALLIFILFFNNDQFNEYPIVDKYEIDGKTYIDVQIEITPDEYIGLDIGDDYVIGK